MLMSLPPSTPMEMSLLLLNMFQENEKFIMAFSCDRNNIYTAIYITYNIPLFITRERTL